MRKLVSLLLGLAISTGALAQTKPPVLPVWASTATPTTDIVQPNNTYIQQGWPLSSTPPSRQYFNWQANYLFNGIRYFSRRSIADWDAAETYQTGDIVRAANGQLTRSLIDNNTSGTGTFNFWGTPLVVSPPNLDNSARIATTAFVHDNYLAVGSTFGAVSGQIIASQVPLNAVQQYQSNLAIGYGQLTGVPSSVSPAGSTLCLRDAAGDGFFRYVNLAQPNNENPVQGTLQVVVTNGADNYTRKSSLPNLAAQINLGSMGGQVSPGQVPQTAVTQYNPQIFAYNPLVSKSVNGYTQIPGGIIEQWGVVTVANNTNNVIDTGFNYTTPFPNAAFFVTVVTDRRVLVNGQAVNASGHCTTIQRTSAICTVDSSGGGVSTFRWFAIGY